MKKIKFFTIGYFIFLCLGVISYEDDCGSFPDKLKVIDLNWNIYEANFVESPNNEPILSEISQNSVLFNKFSISIESRKISYFSAARKLNSINFISSAYACDPVSPKTNDSIENIEIFANNDFGFNYTTGENLVDLFDIIVFDIENDIYYERFDLQTYLSSKPKVPTSMTLILKDSPVETSEFKFTVKFYQNGRDINYFEFETNSLEIRI